MIPIKDNIPTDGAPVVTVALIAVNVIVYLLTLQHGSLLSGPDVHEALRYGAVPHALTRGSGGPHALPQWETVFTSLFVNGSFLALAVNMLFLWIFGNTIEDAVGRIKFALFYVAGGIVALAVAVILAPNSPAPIVGAAGSVAAVIGGYLVLYANGRVLAFSMVPLFFGAVELPILVMVVGWFVLQAAFGATDVTTPTGGGGIVADIAHIGGFLFGMATIRLLATNLKPVPPRVPVV